MTEVNTVAKERRMGGKTIGKWKVELIALGKNDEDTAKAFNSRAEKEGYDYRVDAAKVAQWRAGPKKKRGTRSPRTARTPATSSNGEGSVLPALKALVALVGKEGAKSLIDGL